MGPWAPADSVGAVASAWSGPDSFRDIEAALPSGVVELACDHWRTAERWSEGAGLRVRRTDDDQLADRLGRELTAPLRLEDWPAPTQPRPVAGGWLHQEVIDDDRPLLEAIVADRGRSGPEVLARLAQEMRLPVTPYRQPTGRAIADDETAGPPAAPDGAPRRVAPPLVVDLSSHWAGPLATALLAEAGADVIKLDPSCRPDGFLARPALYRHLNGAKQVIDLDLRHPPDRGRFEHLLGRADLLVESFSRRVLPNLGYDRAALARLKPSLAVVSIKAFPAGSAEADWLAYGPGVHAASGLALSGGRPVPAPIAYPDLVAGIAAYGSAIALIAGGGGHREVSLAGSIAPLALHAAASMPVERGEHG